MTKLRQNMKCRLEIFIITGVNIRETVVWGVSPYRSPVDTEVGSQINTKLVSNRSRIQCDIYNHEGKSDMYRTRMNENGNKN